MKWTWRDVDDIALDLVERYPHIDPLNVSMDEIRRMVVELPTFGDNPAVATDAILDAIQAAWYDEFED